VVLIGPRPQTDLLTLDDAVTLNAGLHKIRVRNQAQTLKTLLNTMVDAIIGATGTVAGGACTITASPNAIATKALIAQLFEE
jgi:hypothetical protein